MSSQCLLLGTGDCFAKRKYNGLTKFRKCRTRWHRVHSQSFGFHSMKETNTGIWVGSGVFIRLEWS